MWTAKDSIRARHSRPLRRLLPVAALGAVVLLLPSAARAGCEVLLYDGLKSVGALADELGYDVDLVDGRTGDSGWEELNDSRHRLIITSVNSVFLEQVLLDQYVARGDA